MRISLKAALLVAVLIAAVMAAMSAPTMVSVRSTIDGRMYRVRNLPGKEEAADHLAKLKRKVDGFLLAAKDMYPCEVAIESIKKRWDGTLSEIPDPSATNVAYTVDKRTISICIRDVTGQIATEDVTMFVLLHELAHVASDTFGHPPEFWDMMRLLLETAESTRFYAYQNFEREPASFCGHSISTSPLTCIKSNACPSTLKTCAA